MSDVAARELCEELYKLSVWDDTDKWILVNEYGETSLIGSKALHNPSYPAYTAGYLLRKLPDETPRQDNMYGASMGRRNLTTYDGKWIASYRYEDEMNPPEHYFEHIADTPEDALASLAIELFKQGILTKVEPKEKI